MMKATSIYTMTILKGSVDPIGVVLPSVMVTRRKGSSVKYKRVWSKDAVRDIKPNGIHREHPTVSEQQRDYMF
jgi:hypothetical protein